MRRKHGFAITAWVFLPDHWHAIIYPPYPLTISTVFKALKVRLEDRHERPAEEAGGVVARPVFRKPLSTRRSHSPTWGTGSCIRARSVCFTCCNFASSRFRAVCLRMVNFPRC